MTVMSKWLNAADNIIEMIILHLPSPKMAQEYRISHLYTGPLDDISAKSMITCDPKGPLMIYISKMVIKLLINYRIYNILKFLNFKKLFMNINLKMIIKILFKQIQKNDKSGRFFAFGRIFSGILSIN